MPTPMTLADARQVRDRVDRESADIRERSGAMARAIVRAFADASQTCPTGTRPAWLTNLAYDVERDLRERGRRIDVARLAMLAIGTQECGGSLDAVLNVTDDLFGDDTATPLPTLRLAVDDETEAQGPADCAELKVLAPDVTVADYDRVIEALRVHEREIRTARRAAVRAKLALLACSATKAAA